MASLSLLNPELIMATTAAYAFYRLSFPHTEQATTVGRSSLTVI